MGCNIVIDKSFLRGAKGDEISQLAGSHKLLMSESLLYECVKEDPWQRAKLFRKFPDPANPYILIPSVGSLLSLEIKRLAPCGKPSDLAEPRDYLIHNDLIDSSYQLTEVHKNALEKKRSEILSDAKDFIELVEVFFTELSLHLGGNKARPEDKLRLQLQLADNPNSIGCSIEEIARTKNSLMPRNVSLNKNWASFRWFQVNKLFALNLACSYDSLETIKKSDAAYQKLVHDVIDAQYLIVALLEDGFATKEKKLIDWWKLLSPNGLLCQ